MKGEILIEKQ